MTVTLTAKEDQELWDEAALYIPAQYDATIGKNGEAIANDLTTAPSLQLSQNRANLH